ncbi:MAG: hypothetical protein ACWA5R_10180 [bacterium]
MGENQEKNKKISTSESLVVVFLFNVKTSVLLVFAVKEYGGKAKNWLKRSGDADVVTTPGNVRRAEVYWYEAHGVGKVEFKVKVWLD